MNDNNYPEAFAAAMRADFRTFLERSFLELNPGTEFKPNWHLDVVCYELERLRLGLTKRLIICVPPRSLKSLCASVAFPAFLLGHNPSAQVICVSYAQPLADKFASDCRALMRSAMYKTTFPLTRLSSQRPALQEFVTTRRGCRLATSVGGVLTGRGADYLVVDDALKPEDAWSDSARKNTNEWFSHTLVTRLNDQLSGRIAIIMQRLHEDDLVGYILDKAGAGDWRLLRFPAIADDDETYTVATPFGKPLTYTRHRGDLLHPEREDRATLDRLLANMGTYNFSAQFLQSPVPMDGGLIKEIWLKTYTDLPDLPMETLQSWDTGMTAGELSDPSVCTTWKVVYPYMHFATCPERYREIHEELYAPKFSDMYLIDVFRKKLNYPDLKKAVIEHKQKFQASTVLIEDKSSGTPLIQDLRRDGHQGIAQYKPPAGHDKVMRMHACCGILEAGRIYLPERAEWLSTYLNEIKAFPYGRHDDQVDSTSQAIHWANQNYFSFGSGSISRVQL